MIRHLSLALNYLMAGLAPVNPWVTEAERHEALARKEANGRAPVRPLPDNPGVEVHWATGKAVKVDAIGYYDPSGAWRNMGTTNEIGWRMVGEVPPGAGKLKAATVFGGMLILAFERGVYRVDHAGRIVPIEFKP